MCIARWQLPQHLVAAGSKVGLKQHFPMMIRVSPQPPSMSSSKFHGALMEAHFRTKTGPKVGPKKALGVLDYDEHPEI